MTDGCANEKGLLFVFFLFVKVFHYTIVVVWLANKFKTM